MKKLFSKGWLTKLLILFVTIVLISCTENDDSLLSSSDKFELVRTHLDSWLSEAGNDKPVKSSSYVKETIIDDWENQQENFQIISVRAADDYINAGHIPNAINIFWKDIVNEESLNQLSVSKTIIFYCYTGHKAMLSGTIVNLLGYKNYNLKFGMMDWNLDALNKTPWDMEADYGVETTINTSEPEYFLPIIESYHNSAEDIVKENARTALLDAIPTISSSDVEAIVDDWENINAEYQIVSVRTSTDYELGHIPHSINIPWTEISKTENLRRLDPNKTIIVYCYTGHTGQIASTLLNILGYNAINMKFGMMDWNLDAFQKTPWDGIADYPVEN
jgi:rhodanese-related sulfurtransferase